METKGFILEDLYKQIIEVMPIPCVDLLVVHKDKYLIAKRTQEPLKGEWYMPGSRLFKGETIQEVVQRIAFKELGIKAKFDKVLLLYLGFYDNGYFGMETETFTLVVLAKTQFKNIKLDNSHSEYMWIAEPFKGLHSYVKKAIEEAK